MPAAKKAKVAADAAAAQTRRGVPEKGRKGGEASSEMPPMALIPETGTYPAVQTDDGSIYVDTSKKPSTHVLFIREKGIPPERVVSGGWMVDGVYQDGGPRSDAGKFGEQARAKARIEAKRAAAIPVHAETDAGPRRLMSDTPGQVEGKASKAKRGDCG
jgi:hypothetical protein